MEIFESNDGKSMNRTVHFENPARRETVGCSRLPRKRSGFTTHGSLERVRGEASPFLYRRAFSAVPAGLVQVRPSLPNVDTSGYFHDVPPGRARTEQHPFRGSPSRAFTLIEL